MLVPDMSQPSSITGCRRALHELCVGLSAAQCMHEMQRAMIGHCTRALTSRLLLEAAGKRMGAINLEQHS